MECNLLKPLVEPFIVGLLGGLIAWHPGGVQSRSGRIIPDQLAKILPISQRIALWRCVVFMDCRNCWSYNASAAARRQGDLVLSTLGGEQLEFAADRSVSDFCLSAGVRHLSHGSFGGTPRLVHQARMRWLEMLEANPDPVFGEQVRPQLRLARSAVAGCFGARPENLVLLQNANSAVQSVIKSVCLSPSDRVICSDHNYSAVRACLEDVHRRCGVQIVTVAVGAGPFRAEEVLGRFEDACVQARRVSGRRLLVVDHVASPSALLFPIAELAQRACDLGFQVLVDGAHGPGMLELDLESLGTSGVTWYAGNLHKWACCPRGSGFLWAHPSSQKQIAPLATQIQEGGFLERFEWLGTFDLSPLLALPEAIDLTAPFRSQEALQRNIRLARAVQAQWVAQTGTAALLPDGMHGSMVALSVPINGHLRARLPARYEAAFLYNLRRRLFVEHRVEVPFTTVTGDELWLRPSCHLYNSLKDYEDLHERVQLMLEETLCT
jgi:isopenicillin-N epimerase